MAVLGTTGLAATADATPSLRLLSSDSSIEAFTYNGRAYIDPPIFVASTGGTFRLDASRPDYGPWQLDQIGPDHTVLRSLPSDLFAPDRGLRHLFTVVVKDDGGSVFRRLRSDLCPGESVFERINDDGPRDPTFPAIGCSLVFPFVRGLVYGIDDGWGLDPGLNFDLKASPGTYTVTIRFTRSYRRALAIAPDDASTRIEVVVQSEKHGGERPPIDRPNPDPNPNPKRGANQTRAARSVPIVTDPDPAYLPDLAALPAWDLATETDGHHDRLTFAATVWNSGTTDLIVEGYRRSDSEVMDAFQYFLDQDGEVTGRAPVGELRYHHANNHDHWHFQQFANYSLLAADQSTVVVSKKQSFCIYPTDIVDLTIPGASFDDPGYLGGGGLASSCGAPDSVWIREVLVSGWGDTYVQSIAGQAFDISALPNGTYYVAVTVNPTGRLYDRTTESDQELRQIELGGVPGHRTVTAAPWNGITR